MSVYTFGELLDAAEDAPPFTFGVAHGGRGDLWPVYVRLAYTRTHRRLPGSLRTARLRKKRHDFVLRWWYAHSLARTGFYET